MTECRKLHNPSFHYPHWPCSREITQTKPSFHHPHWLCTLPMGNYTNPLFIAHIGFAHFPRENTQTLFSSAAFASRTSHICALWSPSLIAFARYPHIHKQKQFTNPTFPWDNNAFVGGLCGTMWSCLSSCPLFLCSPVAWALPYTKCPRPSPPTPQPPPFYFLAASSFEAQSLTISSFRIIIIIIVLCNDIPI